MALESIIRKDKNEQVLVDMPIVVDKPVEKKKSFFRKENIPWKWIMLVLILFVGMFGVIFLWRKVSILPDLEINAPKVDSQGVSAVNVLDTSAMTGAVLSGSPYTNPLDGFEITPPNGWSVDDSRKTNAAVIFLNPEVTIIDDKNYATLINVEMSKADGVQLMDQIDVIKKDLKVTFPDFAIENDIVIYLQGVPYYLIGGTYHAGTVQIRRISLVTILNDRGYAVSASGPVSTWKNYEKVINDSIYSFKVL